jgi:hypothetical protein
LGRKYQEENPMNNMLQAVIGLSGASFKKGGFSGITEQILRVEMPKTFKGEGLQKSRKDLELLLKMLSDHPEDSTEMLDAVIQNRISDARKIAERLGLDEHNFNIQGGGLIWVVVVVVVIVVVINQAPGLKSKNRPD